jgi:hypothetical protein
MNRYNPHLHHRRSIRLKGYDHSQSGLYFITICCQNRICRFGHIENGKMILNEYGQVAYNEWYKTSELRPNVSLAKFQVMPNHIHGILRLWGRGELPSPPNTIELLSPEHHKIQRHSLENNLSGIDSSHHSACELPLLDNNMMELYSLDNVGSFHSLGNEIRAIRPYAEHRKPLGQLSAVINHRLQNN